MNLGLILITWAIIAVIVVACLLNSGIVTIEITKDDPDDPPEEKGNKH